MYTLRLLRRPSDKVYVLTLLRMPSVVLYQRLLRIYIIALLRMPAVAILKPSSLNGLGSTSSYRGLGREGVYIYI